MCCVQFYGTNEDTSHVFFGDASTKKFGTYFVKDGKVSCHSKEDCSHQKEGWVRACVYLHVLNVMHDEKQPFSFQAGCISSSVRPLSSRFVLAMCFLSIWPHTGLCCKQHPQHRSPHCTTRWIMLTLLRQPTEGGKKIHLRMRKHSCA